jgi:hypothetical protein
MIIGGFAARVRILLKRTIKTPYFRRSGNSRKLPENYILPKDSGSQKEESRGARGPPHT